MPDTEQSKKETKKVPADFCFLPPALSSVRLFFCYFIFSVMGIESVSMHRRFAYVNYFVYRIGVFIRTLVIENIFTFDGWRNITDTDQKNVQQTHFM